MVGAWASLLAFAVDPAAFLEMAKRSDTDGLVILQNGQRVVSYSPSKRVHVQSVSKTLLSLAAGCLRTDGRLPSLDITLGEVIPKLQGDPKARVTLRQLMAHVSGVQHLRNEKGSNSEQFKALRDTRAYAFGQPLEDPPGAKRRYNNTGMILTVAMIEAIAGEPLPQYLDRRLFRPMGIRSADWMKDRAGNAFGYMGLVINAEDLAKLGQLVLDDGKWEGRSLIDEAWIRESTRQATFPAASGGQSLIWMFQGLPPDRPPFLIQHSGDGGNWLVIFPDLKLVAARVRDARAEDPVNFPEFVYQRFK
jgi:CubicO group peptidase (beta-lactamase class C family)